MTPQDITIAVTVFDRRTYIEQAVASALQQTVPVRVMVVEDCGPDAGLRDFVLSRFGARIRYHRNRQRRGLFDNWNACLELCPTPWMCLLHDDDFLEPNFVEAQLHLAAQFPGRGLYYGRCQPVDMNGQVVRKARLWGGPECRAVAVQEFALRDPVSFPGELFRADSARALGGFRKTSSFTGDWDMWFQLALHHGAATIERMVGNVREHQSEGRGTTRVLRNGKFRALTIVQVKQNAARLRQHGEAAVFDRAVYLAHFPMAVHDLLGCASGYTPRMLAYNVGLLLRSSSPGVQHFLFRGLARCFGPGFVRVASGCYQRLRR